MLLLKLIPQKIYFITDVEKVACKINTIPK